MHSQFTEIGCKGNFHTVHSVAFLVNEDTKYLDHALPVGCIGRHSPTFVCLVNSFQQLFYKYKSVFFSLG